MSLQLDLQSRNGGARSLDRFSRVGVNRQPIVTMVANAMMRLAGLIRRIDVNDDKRRVIEVMKEPVANLGGDRMRLRNR